MRSLGTSLLLAGFASLVLGTLFFMGFDLTRALTDLNVYLFIVPSLLLLGVHLWRERPWTYVASAIAVGWGPTIVLLLFGSVENLVRPLVGAEYQGSLFLLLAVVLASLGGTLGFRTARTPTRGPSASGHRATVMGAMLVAAAVVGAAFAGGVATAAHKQAAAMGGAYDFEPGTAVEIVLRAYAFEPASVAIPRGEIVEVVVHNLDHAFHTLTYESGGRVFDHAIPDDSTTRFLVKFDDAGTIRFWCTPHSDAARGEGEGMIGHFVVS